ncbi:MAG: flagellin [Alphaproteobacteria bacterium]|nr:flagellin [Alphaproteobacteria bacterium]
MAIENSVVTNASAFVALRNFSNITRDLDITQNRVSTGLRVASAIDDSSNFAIAQGIRAELKALSAVSQGLNNTKGIGKVALAGTTGVSNLLGDLRAKLTEMGNTGVTTAQRDILSSDFNDLMSQAGNFILNATFNGINMLTDSASNVNTLANLSNGTLSLGSQDLQTTAEALASASFSTATASQSTITTEFASLEAAVNSALGGLGADVRALELQTDFLNDISDATEEGLGNIVDADMARESARLTALQVQQQLAVQTLSIVNQAPQTLLGLFR